MQVQRVQNNNNYNTNFGMKLVLRKNMFPHKNLDVINEKELKRLVTTVESKTSDIEGTMYVPGVWKDWDDSRLAEHMNVYFNNGNYNKVIKRLLNKGVHVFAPQLLLWEETRLGPKTERQWVDTTLKQLGGSVTALEIYCIERCIDWLETKEFVNKSFGMIGLSYGGFYTMFTTAVDTRIKAAVSSSQFNNRYRYNWSDWVFQNAANTFFDFEVAALIYPRPFYIEVGDTDQLFDVLFAKQEIKRLEKYYADAAENLKFHVFKGVHEFSADIEMGIDFMLSHL